MLFLVLAFFGPAMAGFQRLAFRDVGHFYPPLYQFIGDADSVWPLWNPFDHTGIPVAGETTTALFYPPRLVFSLGFAASVAMGWYVAIHSLLAAASSTWAARKLGCGWEASLLSGVLYAFSGPVLFLYCNPPFLVGAAWLPFALGGALRLAEGWSASDWLITTIGLAMCMLGGDPQTTVHVGLVVGGTLLCRQIAWFRSPRIQSGGEHRLKRRPYWSPVLLAAALAGMLAAPQIAAALDWSRHSARRYQPPAGVSRLLTGSVGASDQRWWQPPPADSHAAAIYGFSIPPWHWLDLLNPKLSGELFPRYQRLSALLPDDGRVWTISLYFGVVPLLSLLARYVRSHRHRIWQEADIWDALIPLGIFFSLGSFGPVWFLTTGLHVVGITSFDSVHEALFSPYWAAVTTIPGYGVFRYPAKWLPIAILGCSVATARSLTPLDKATRARMQHAAKWIGLLGLASAITSAAVLLWPQRLKEFAAKVPSDEFWGPLAVESAVGAVFFSSLHVFVFAGGAAWLLRAGRNGASSFRVTALGGLLCLDLLVVGYGQIAAIDRRAEQRWLATLETGEDPLQPFDRLIRSRIGNGWPLTWSRASSPNRLLEVEASGRHVLFGRWHMEHSLGALNSATSIVPQRTDAFWRAAKRRAERLPVEHRTAFWETVARILAVNALVSRSEQGVERRDSRGRELLFADRGIRKVEDPLPKVRWHERWETISPQRYVSEQAWTERLDRWNRDGNRYLPVLESDDASDRFASPVPETQASDGGAETTIRVIARTPSETVVELSSARRGLLLLSQYQDGNWDAEGRQGESAWQRMRVHPVDYLGQGIVLPSGDWQVRVRYRPQWLLPSLVLSAAGVSLIAGLYVAIRRRNGLRGTQRAQRKLRGIFSFHDRQKTRRSR